MVSEHRRLTAATVAFAAILLQTVIMPDVRVAGVIPDIVVLTVVAAAIQLGPESGMLYGFGAGLTMDFFLSTPLGLTALAYTVVAYVVSAGSTGLLRNEWWVYPALGGLGSMAGTTLFLVAGVLVGQDQFLQARSLVVVAMSGAFGVPLSVLIVPAVAKLLPGHEGRELLA